MDPSSKGQARDGNLDAPSQAKGSAHSAKPLSSKQPCSQNIIRFADPRKKAQNVFELYLRKSVSRSVRKCQGRCRKRITAEDPPMIIRSIGKSWWTDKKTGKEMSRVGSILCILIKPALNSLTLKFFMVPPKDLTSVA